MVKQMNNQMIEMYSGMQTELENKRDEYQRLFDAMSPPKEMSQNDRDHIFQRMVDDFSGVYNTLLRG